MSSNIQLPRQIQSIIDEAVPSALKLYSEIKNKLKSTRITNAEDIRQMFLRYDADRTGFITRENLKDLFRKVSLPLDDDIINTVKSLLFILI